LTCDGYLSLAKKSSQLPYNRIQLLDFTNFNFAEDSQSLTFDSVEDGVLVVSPRHLSLFLFSFICIQRAIIFYCLEQPTFDEWVRCIQRVRDTSSQYIPPPTRNIRFLKEKSRSMKALFHHFDEPDSPDTSDLAQIDPVLVRALPAPSLPSLAPLLTFVPFNRKCKQAESLSLNQVFFEREAEQEAGAAHTRSDGSLSPTLEEFYISRHRPPPLRSDNSLWWM
jgi:hypothetical protein